MAGELVVCVALEKPGKQYVSINPTWPDYQYRCYDMVAAGSLRGRSVLLRDSGRGVKISNR